MISDERLAELLVACERKASMTGMDHFDTARDTASALRELQELRQQSRPSRLAENSEFPFGILSTCRQCKQFIGLSHVCQSGGIEPI